MLLRPDREQKTNHIYHWEVGDKDATARARVEREAVSQRIWFQRCHPAPLEPCGCVAHFDTMGRLQFYVTSQAPHVYRTALALVTGIPEDKIHVISPDIGGGFGNKVPVYPGYVCAVVGALKLGRPVKWIETRTENLTSRGSRATITWTSSSAPPRTVGDRASRVHRRRPRRVRCGRGSHEVSGRHVRRRDRQLRHPCRARGSRRALHQQGAGRHRLPLFLPRHRGQLRDRARDGHPRRRARPRCRGAAAEELHQEGAVSVSIGLGFTYDSGDYHKTLDKALEIIGYRTCSRSRRRSARGELMGIGISTFTEVVGAGPSKHFDILGSRCSTAPRSASIRPAPVSSARGRNRRVRVTKRRGRRSWPRSSASIRRTSWWKRATPTRAIRPRHLRESQHAGGGRGHRDRRAAHPREGRKIAAHLLEVGEADVEWKDYKFQVKGVPAKSVTMKEVAFAAYTNPGPNEPGLEATNYYDPPNMTFPHGTYIAVVDIDRETGEVKVRRFLPSTIAER